jgi:hypothetical protein
MGAFEFSTFAICALPFALFFRKPFSAHHEVLAWVLNGPMTQ